MSIVKWPESKDEFYDYLLSLIRFDGYVDSDKRVVIYDPEYSFLLTVGQLANKYFNTSFSVNPRHNYHVYILRIYSKDFAIKVKQHLSDFELLNINHIRGGLFDAEGSIYYDEFGLRIEVKIKDKKYIEQLSKILRDLNINNHTDYDKKYFDPRRNKSYTYNRLRIRAIDDLIKFIHIVGVRQERKLRIINNYLNNDHLNLNLS